MTNRHAPQTTFTITNDHLKLVRAMYWDWQDSYGHGAPGVDQKRPYGNSYVESDVAETLGWDVDEENGLTDEQTERAAAIHRETLTVLQIMIETFDAPGLYVVKPQGGWVHVG